jgi:protein-tyrosine phosphatase
VILVVCTGNICRSPMTQALLQRHLRERGLDIPVSSAGILGWNEGPAVDEAVAALADRGIELNGHVSRRIDGDLIRDADLVLTMTSDHAEAVRRAGAGVRVGGVRTARRRCWLAGRAGAA